MRAKLKVQTVTRSEHSETVQFSAVAAKAYPTDGSDENNTYAKWSPTADLKLVVANPALFGALNPGEEYYVDFTKAEA